jgi:hypothetical protein
MTQERQYGKWTENESQIAVVAYRNGNCGSNECTRVYGIPRATIWRRAMKKNWYVNGVKALGRQATFFGDMEEILADPIIMLEEYFCGLGLSIEDVRKLAFDLAEKYKFPHTFNKEKMLAAKNCSMHLCEEILNCLFGSQRLPH